jgi:predicted secreted hydrolase
MLRAASATTAVLLGLMSLVACSTDTVETGRARGIAVSEAMGGGPADGFARATEVRRFVFPDDHGPHEEFRTEWWYFTGNLRAEGGDAFGFQLTFFRHALAPAAPPRASRWATRDVWFAHFAVGDEARGRFHAFERFQRGALDLAGARPRPFTVWVGDWRAQSVDEVETFPLRLVADEDRVALELLVEPRKPVVLQGNHGLSQKGPEPGNASYYYSLTRLAASGTLTLDGRPYPVTGHAWLDREWSTSALSEGQVGWDWFAIQLDDGRELMLYRMRRDDGATDPHSSGVLVDTDGSTRTFRAGDVRYEPGRQWKSPGGDAAYPVEWRISVEPLGLELEVEAMLDASELEVSVRYWEGAIRISGRDRSGPLSGHGFLEMTGYATWENRPDS